MNLIGQGPLAPAPIPQAPIAQATVALLAMLDEHCPREHFPEAIFVAYQPDDFTSPMEEGISLYLFRVDANADPRQGRTLYLSYLLTAWSPDAIRQQQLLGWAVRMVQRNPGLEQNLRLEMLSLPMTDVAAVWSMARVGAQPSIAVMVRAFD